MEFTVQQSDFARELKFAERVAEKRSTVPVLANVLLVARGDRVYLTATDLELGIQCSCPANVSSEGAATVPLRRLLDYVRLLPGGEVKVKFGENARASVTCGRSGARIAGLAAESYPELPKMPDASTDLRVDALSSMIAKTAFAISATESRFTLNGALFQIKDGSTSMIATDGHRLALTETVEPPPANGEGAPNRTPCRAVVPRKAIRELLNLMTEGDGGKTVAFAEDENHLFFRFGLRLLITRKLAGTFPDCERVLSADHNLAVIVEREALRSAIERVAQFADERSHSVRVPAFFSVPRRS